MFDNGLVALELLGRLGFWWLMKLTSVVLVSGWDRGGGRKEGVHTQSIRTDVVTGETIELKEIGCVKRAEVEEVLPTFRH